MPLLREGSLVAGVQKVLTTSNYKKSAEEFIRGA